MGDGFLDSSFDQSSSNASYTRKPMGDTTMRPITIKQISTASNPQDGIFKMDNADVTQVTFIAIVRNIQNMNNYIIYTVEDGTGMAEVRRWTEQTEAEEEVEERRNIQIDTYVRIHGRLNSFNGRVTVVSFSVRPVLDYNEISYHFLDVVAAHLTFTKPTHSKMFLDKPTSNNINELVNNAIKSFSDQEDGANVDQIIYKFKDMFTETEIRKSIDFLTHEGHCYFIDGHNNIKSTEY